MGLFAQGEDLPMFTGAGGLTKADQVDARALLKHLDRQAAKDPRAARVILEELEAGGIVAPATRSSTSSTRSPAPVDRQLNANRQRRALQRLDKALGRRSMPAKPTPEQRERRERAAAGHRDAVSSYNALKRAILANGGIRGNADYKRGEIPADVYRPRGQPADEMAQFLAGDGFHYGGDVELMTDLHRRRDRVRDTLAGRGRKANPQLICMDIERDHLGRFVRHR